VAGLLEHRSLVSVAEFVAEEAIRLRLRMGLATDAPLTLVPGPAVLAECAKAARLVPAIALGSHRHDGDPCSCGLPLRTPIHLCPICGTAGCACAAFR